MKKRLISYGLVIGILVFALLSASLATAKTRYLFATGPSTGGWYPTGAQIAEIIMKANPDLDLTVTEGSAASNIRDVNAGHAHIGYTFSSTLAQAHAKMKPFNKETIDQVAGFLTFYKSLYQAFVHADSDIKTFADLKDKRIAPGRRNWGGEILTRGTLKEYGLTYDSIKKAGGKIDYVGFSDMTMLMRDRHIDSAMGISAAPSAFIMDLKATHKVRFLGIDDKHAKLIMANNPGFAYTELAPNTYKDQPEAVKTLSVHTITFIRKDMPVDTVYRMTKTVMENLEEVYKAHPVIKFLTKKTALEGFKPDEVHPGVVKYFKEIGEIK